MAFLYFTCPNTNRIAPTDVEMDVQGLRTHWRSTLILSCPHCDDMHDVCVREVYLAACVDGLDPSESSALARRSMYGQRRSTKYCAPASLPEDQVVRIAGTVEARSTAELEKGKLAEHYWLSRGH